MSFDFRRPTGNAYVLLLTTRANCCHGITIATQVPVSSHPPGASRESVGVLAENLPTHASYSKVTGWHDAVVDFASGLDVCCHLSAMPLVLVCLLERLVATENDWGPNDDCALTPCSTCGEGLRYRW